MNQNDNFVRLDFLIALAAEHGQRINARWLAKYARKGLLPHALATPGVGQGKGRTPRYPPSTSQQLMALIQQRRIHGKNLRNVGWALWRDGFSVERRYWHPRLARVARLWQRHKQLFGPGDSLNIGTAERKLIMLKAQMAQNRKVAPILGPAKRALKQDFKHFVDAILSVGAGKYERIADLAIYDENGANWETELLAKALRIPKEIPERAQWTRLRIDAASMDKEFSVINGLARQNIDKWFTTRTDAEITECRDELFQFMYFLLQFENMSAHLLKKSLGADVLARCWKHIDAQVGMLVGWLYLRKNREKRENMRALVENMRVELAKLHEMIRRRNNDLQKLQFAQRDSCG